MFLFIGWCVLGVVKCWNTFVTLEMLELIRLASTVFRVFPNRLLSTSFVRYFVEEDPFTKERTKMGACYSLLLQ